MAAEGTKHFHVYLGGTHGFMHGAADFDNVQDSINFFFGLSDDVLKGAKIETPRATAEWMMTECAKVEDNEAIYIDNGKMRLVWVVCTDVCLKYMRN